ncbi:CPBP family intramembrane glutamic endopeptidase [Pukyongiella litopenaei]|uniref:CPBP family intramembrane glutamic endopeptidase n=1 Tax=Pukyongiella litopenaei TaxID=2605946 RepID=UPI00313C397A
MGPARGRPALWRLVAGLVLVALIAMGLNAVFGGLARLAAPEFWRETLRNPALLGSHPVALLVLLASFGFVALGVALAARLLQQRAPAGLVGPLPLAVRQFWRVFRLLLVLAAVVMLLPPWDYGEPLVQNMAPGRWLLLLPLSLGAVLVQTATEELLFRGYIQQSLAARFAHPAVWMLLPSALFAAGHYLPAQAGDNAVLIALWSGLFGVLMADLTARAGTLGPAIAVHFANNVVSLLIVSLPDGLSGLALFTLPYEMSDTTVLRGWLAVDFMLMLLGWLTARLAIRA